MLKIVSAAQKSCFWKCGGFHGQTDNGTYRRTSQGENARRNKKKAQKQGYAVISVLCLFSFILYNSLQPKVAFDENFFLCQFFVFLLLGDPQCISLIPLSKKRKEKWNWAAQKNYKVTEKKRSAKLHRWVRTLCEKRSSFVGKMPFPVTATITQHNARRRIKSNSQTGHSLSKLYLQWMRPLRSGFPFEECIFTMIYLTGMQKLSLVKFSGDHLRIQTVLLQGWLFQPLPFRWS